MNGIVKIGLFLLLTAGSSLPAGAEVPARYEQFVYTAVAFNGRDYSGTFVRQPSESLYLIADSDSFVSAKLTFVYFWPLSGDYKLDTGTMNYPLDGTLRIEGGARARSLSLESYTYYQLREEYEPSWKVATGDAAVNVVSDYQRLADEYGKAQLAYRLAEADYERKLDDLMSRIARLHERGGDTTKLVEELKALAQPEAPPAAVTDYITPPVKIQKAFVVNLPAGTYRMAFINPDGKVMEGSEKRLIVFSPTEAERVGYDVIPGDKWTRAETSELPRSVIYVSGATDLYLRPYFEAKYNDLFYKKLANNDAVGNANLLTWAKLRQVPQGRLLLRAGSGQRSVREQAFGVQQVEGASLGYRIVPWDATVHDNGRKPDIIAYPVTFSDDHRIIRLEAFDGNGARLAGGGREIRVLAGSWLEIVLAGLVLLPFAPMAVAMARRTRRFKR